MKAFVLYKTDEIELRQLCRRLQDYGTVNCTFEQFVEIYQQWYMTIFPGRPINYATATFRDDWFRSFLNYLVNYEL